MLNPLVKRGLFFSIEKRGFYPIKWGRWTLGGISPLGINLSPKHVFVCRERPANLYRVSWRSVKGTKKRKKNTLVLNISPPPPINHPLRTLFVLCLWGGVTDIITHAKFHLNRFSSFGSPGGRKSPFPIGLENNGSYNSVTH